MRTPAFCPSTYTNMSIMACMNCEDMAMNMMVSGLTGSAPVYVHSDKVYDFGTSHGISISTGFTHRRDQCVQDLVTLFGRDTLQENTETVGRYHKNAFRKLDWAEFDDVLVSMGPPVLFEAL